VAVGEVTGEIIDTPRGTGGFGYDPIFLRPELGRTFAEIHTHEKNGLSHRGVALGAMRPVLDRLAREAATATGG
jgi:XTP/dITP diphosphohydrolase